jgi:hypothetical protein
VPPEIGAGAPESPASDPAALRALAAWQRRLDDVEAAPWRWGRDDRAAAETERAAAEGRRPESWALSPADRLSPFRVAQDADELRAYYRDAAAWRAALRAQGIDSDDPQPFAEPAADAPGSSLDTWEHLQPTKLAQRPPGQADGDRDRARRYDRAKAALVPAIRAAAGELAHADPAAPGPAILDKMAWNVAGCREVRAFRDAGCGSVWAQPVSCDVRLCPDCERSRSAAAARRFAELAAPMRRPLFGVLTIANVPPGFLALGLDVLGDAWARLRRAPMFAGGPCRRQHQDPDDRPDAAGGLPPRREPCRHGPHREPAARSCASCGHRAKAHAASSCAFTPAPCRCARCLRGGRGCRRCVHAPVLGGVASVEVTLGKRGDWHPHMNFVADAPYLPWRELRDAWRACSCDAFRAAVARGADTGRSSGYRRQEQAGRSGIERCAHLADAQGRPADTRCPAGHGWRIADGDRCPHQDRDASAPCGMPGEDVPEPKRCRGASMVWVQAPRARGADAAGAAAVREAVKYATKGLLDKDGVLVPAVRESPSLLGELLLVLRGRRLVQGWGSLHGVTDDPEDADRPDLVPVEVGDYRPLMVPRVCPHCGVDALWSYLGRRARSDCLPAAGRLWYRPDSPPGPPS